MENTHVRFVSFSTDFLDLATAGFVKNTGSILLLLGWLGVTTTGHKHNSTNVLLCQEEFGK
jgi:hypothetical protein